MDTLYISPYGVLLLAAFLWFFYKGAKILIEVLTGVKEERTEFRYNRYKRFREKYARKFDMIEIMGGTWEIGRDEQYYLNLFKRWKV